MAQKATEVPKVKEIISYLNHELSLITENEFRIPPPPKCQKKAQIPPPRVLQAKTQPKRSTPSSSLKSKGNYSSDPSSLPSSFPQNQRYNENCPFCNIERHPVSQCKNFTKLDIQGRRDFVIKNRLCFNCLSRSHISPTCKSHNCTICSQKHHTALHIPKQNNLANNQQDTLDYTSASADIELATPNVLLGNRNISVSSVLPTIKVLLSAENGTSIIARGGH